MKKSYVLLTLAALLELTSCTAHYSKQLDNMITIDGNTISLSDVFAAYGGTSKTASSLYSVLNNIYIQMAEPRTASMDAAVNAKYKTEYEEKAESNATSNNTSVKEEKEKLLEAAGVDTEEQYKNKLYLEQQTSNLDDLFSDEDFIQNTNGEYASYLNSSSELTKTSPLDQYIDENYPYHMRHILVKVDGSNKFRGEITADQAKKISNVVQQLGVSGSTANGYDGNLSYGQIANELSDDSSSAENYGDTGLMNKIGGTTLVNEFRFGTYSWDMYYDTDSAVNTSAKSGLLPSSDTTDGAMANQILADEFNDAPSVFGSSYLETLVMGKLSDVTSAFDNKVDVENVSAQNYPRNILFSLNYNYHGLGVIYVEDPAAALGENETKAVAKLQEKYGLSTTDAKDVYDKLCDAYNNANNVDLDDDSLAKVKSNFKVLKETVNSEGVPEVSAVDFNESLYSTGSVKIVFDDKTKTGNGTSTPILVTRVSSSYEGVHFMSVIKNPFKSTGTGNTMKDYLTLDVNTATERNTDGSFKTHNYINYIDYGKDAVSSYSSRKDAIIDDNISSRDSNTTFAKNEYIKNKALSDGHTVKLSDYNDNLVKTYVEKSIASNNLSSTETYDSSWLSYVEGLAYQVDNYSNKFYGTLGYSSISAFNKAIIGKYIVSADEALEDGQSDVTKTKTGVYLVKLYDFDEASPQVGTYYYTTNDITLATGYEKGKITLNPSYITSSGSSGGSTSTDDSSSSTDGE